MRTFLFAKTIRLMVMGALAVGLCCPASRAAGICASSPAAALKAFESGLVSSEAGGEGYRVTRIHRDAVLGTRWASVERCGHPEWPGVTVAASGALADGANETAELARVRSAGGIAGLGTSQKVVRPGDTVRLWRQDTNVRMEMAAVSDEGGAAGDRIRIRVTTHQESGDEVRYVYGLVRGPADVEME